MPRSSPMTRIVTGLALRIRNRVFSGCSGGRRLMCRLWEKPVGAPNLRCCPRWRCHPGVAPWRTTGMTSRRKTARGGGGSRFIDLLNPCHPRRSAVPHPAPMQRGGVRRQGWQLGNRPNGANHQPLLPKGQPGHGPLIPMGRYAVSFAGWPGQANGCQRLHGRSYRPTNCRKIPGIRPAFCRIRGFIRASFRPASAASG